MLVFGFSDSRFPSLHSKPENREKLYTENPLVGSSVERFGSEALLCEGTGFQVL